MPTSAGLGPVQYDIGLIPVASIERIEILRGGASAIYGADAVAGVVNIITKKDYTGFKLETGAAATTNDFDYHEYDLSVGAGAATDRARVNVGVSFNYRSELTAAERDFTDGTVDQEYAEKRQRFLTEQGYAYSILPAEALSESPLEDAV